MERAKPTLPDHADLPVTLLAAGAARATPGARSSLASSPRELLVADAVEALYELPPLPAQTDARELTTYEEAAWGGRCG